MLPLESSLSYRFRKPDFKILVIKIFAIVFACIPILLVIEIITYIPGAENIFPTPSPGFLFKFPEMQLKLKKYFANPQIECIIFGSSLVDTGVDPKILTQKLKGQFGDQFNCLNFGLSGSMLEVTEAMSLSMVNWHKPKIVFLGISPFEFDAGYLPTRTIEKLPVFTFYKSNPSVEGWLFNKFRLPWYFVSLSNANNLGYKSQLNSWDVLLDDSGMRRGLSSEEPVEIRNPYQRIRLHQYSINQLDVIALVNMISEMKSKQIKFVIFEMPIFPSYLPYYVGGGQKVYLQKFREPMIQILDENGMDLITSEINGIDYSQDIYWRDRVHLSNIGAEVFTNNLADKTNLVGGW